jgi:hypothetical protein
VRSLAWRGGATIAAVACLVLGACEGTPGYKKSGADATQTSRDYDDCRAKVNAYLAKDRGIDEDRGSVMANDGRPGAGGVRQQMEGNTEGRRSGRLLRDCMEQKGYVGGEPDRPGIRW